MKKRDKPLLPSNASSKASMTFSGLKSGLFSAGKQLKGTYQDVAQSVAAVKADRAANGTQTNFLNQIRTQIVHDRSQRREEEARGTQKVVLFPGWAARRYEPNQDATGGPLPFRIEVFVSGYAYYNRPPEKATRSQKLFVGIAKSFAALPKIPSSVGIGHEDSIDVALPTSRSTEDLLKLAPLPPRPDEMTPEREAETLRVQDVSAPLAPPNPKFFSEEPEALLPSDASRPRLPGGMSSSSNPMYTHRNSSSTSVSTSSIHSRTNSLNGESGGVLKWSVEEIMRMHDNFHRRLQPFWGRFVTTGTVRLSLYPTNPVTGVTERQHGPLWTTEISLATETGYFGHVMAIPYKSILKHPAGAQLTAGNKQNITAVAEYILPPPPLRPGLTPQPSSVDANATPIALRATTPISPSNLRPEPICSAQLDYHVSDTRVRVISDIDDTIKISHILHGVRSVFRNVFVRPLSELACPGMPEWYNAMGALGVNFHYVSNSPFELLPVISEFLKIIGYPAGSVKLKYYGTKSLFKGVWEPAGERKRAGVVEIMDFFQDSKFFLVGDSGEQDMELYTSLAKEWHLAGRDQILGIFIRDVNPEPKSGQNTSLPPLGRHDSAAFTPPQMSPTRQSFSGSYPGTRASTDDDGAFLSTSSSVVAQAGPSTPGAWGEPPSYSPGLARPSMEVNGSKSSGELNSASTIKVPQQYRNVPPPIYTLPPPTLSPTSFTSTPTPKAQGQEYSSDYLNATPTMPTSYGMPIPSSSSRSGATSPIPPPIPSPTLSNSSQHSGTHGPATPPRHQSSVDSALSDTAVAAAMASAESSKPSLTKKRAEFKVRLAKARHGMPDHIPLVIFEHPEECYDTADRILQEVGMGSLKGAAASMGMASGPGFFR